MSRLTYRMKPQTEAEIRASRAPQPEKWPKAFRRFQEMRRKNVLLAATARPQDGEKHVCSCGQAKKLSHKYCIDCGEAAMILRARMPATASSAVADKARLYWPKIVTHPIVTTTAVNGRGYGGFDSGTEHSQSTHNNYFDNVVRRYEENQ